MNQITYDHNESLTSKNKQFSFILAAIENLFTTLTNISNDFLINYPTSICLQVIF